MSPFRIFAVLLALTAGRSWAAVTITGVEDEILENARLYVTEQPDCSAALETVERFAADLPQALRPALEAFGHYSAELSAEIQPPENDCWQVRVDIAPGRPVSVRNVSVELAGAAEDDAILRALFDAFPLESGDPLRHSAYRTFKDRVEVLARQRGYLEGRFSEQRLEVYADQAIADIALTFSSGRRYAFGEVSFDTEALSDQVLDSFLTFDEGQPFDAALIARLQRELTASRYFSDATVRADYDAVDDGRIPVRVDVAADRPTSYSVGVGYSTDDGPRLRFSYDNERRNRAGHQLHAEALLSQVRQTATFEYRVPAGNPQRKWWSYRAGLAREDIDAGVGAAARLGVRRTSVRDLVTMTGFVDALFESDDVAADSVSTQMLIPGVTWARSYRDDLACPREGHRVSAVLSAGFSEDVNLLQVDIRGKWITATPWDGRVLIRGRVGTIFEDGDFRRVPLSMRFFAGGDNSVRGYDYQSLGPEDEAGELLGGNRLIEASVEYEHPLLEDWAMAVFVDSGNAYLDSGFETRTGAGVGVRWFSPIGPVRVDVAWPLDDPDRPPELHLSLGPDL